MVINMDVQDNGNILVEEENTIYEIDGKCMMQMETKQQMQAKQQQ